MHTILVSSKIDNRDRQFEGYCFIGTDYVYGQEGLELYEASTGKQLCNSEDGKFVLVERRGTNFHFLCDYWGYFKLFYYSHDGFWAVSNSFLVLCEHLREHGVELSPNFPVFRSMLIRGNNAFEQIFSFDLAYREIKLVPAGCVLSIGEDGAEITSTRKRSVGIDYRDQLACSLELLVSRHETLLSSNTVTSVNYLSGGMDSRVAFSLCCAAQRRLQLPPEKVNVASWAIGRDATDLQIASTICEKLGFGINQEIERHGRSVNGFEAVDEYRRHFLGAYLPISFPSNLVHPFDVSLGGGGGENLKVYLKLPKPGLAFWRSREPKSAFSYGLARRSPHRLDRWRLQKSIFDAMSSIDSHGGEGFYDLILYFTHFRSRFHAGRPMQLQTHFCPLSAKTLDDCVFLAGPKRLNQAQLHYDILASLEPALLEIPFDKPRKSPSPAVLDSIVAVKIGNAPSPGRVFAKEPRLKAALKDDTNPFNELLRQVGLAAGKSVVRKVFDQATIDQAKRVLADAAKEGNLPSKSAGTHISAILTAAIAD